MNSRLYLETTIPSYLVARPSKNLRLAADQEATKEWWEHRRQYFDLFISEVVLREAGRGDAHFVADRLKALRGIPVLKPLAEAEALAERLVRDGVLLSVAADNATHVGFAAAHRLDYLLTWNCRHINNRAIVRRIEQACAACGLSCPVIATPVELMNS